MATAAEDVQPPRKAVRKRVLIRGTLFAPQGAYVVWIREIWATGALVASEDRLPNGCDVILKRGAIFAAGHVTSSDGTGAGIKFYRKLAERDIATAVLALPSRAE